MTPRRARGFTLVELMVVVSIVALMLAIGTPALLGSLPGLRAGRAAREVLSDLRLARTLTVEKGRPVVVKFHVDGAGSPDVGSYVLAHDDSSPPDDDFTPGTDELIKVVDVPAVFSNIVLASNFSYGGPADGVTLDAGVANAVTFRTNGSAKESGAVYLMPAAGDDDENRRVRLIAATGNLRIESYEGGSWQ